MKYNYITSIFLLILVIIISEAVYIHSKKNIEGFCFLFGCRRSRKFDYKYQQQLQRIREAAQRARANFVARFVNSRQTPYVNLLGTAYSNNQTTANLTAYNESSEIDNLKTQTKECNNDSDIGKIFMLTSDFLNGNGQNSTKVYFLSEILIKSLGQFFIYNIQSNETQYNYLSIQYPNTFKDDTTMKNKYMKFCNLMALAEVAKSTTSTSLQPGGNYFKKLSEPIISRAREIIKEFTKIKYELTEEEKKEIKDKYKTIVKQ
jgi:hypothetical protein